MRPTSLVLLALAAGASAQAPAWQLPPRGAAEYQRESQLSSDVAASRRAALQLECTGRYPAAYRSHLAPAPWLCEGELDPGKRLLRSAPRGLRDVMRHVAFDLTLGSRARLELPRVLPFGDLQLTGKESADADGAQRFDFKIKSRPPQALPEEGKAELRRFVQPLCKYDAQGTLALSRVFDVEAGVVRSFEATLSLVFEDAPDQWRKLVLTDKWQLVAVHENQDAAFRGAIADAIRKGAAWVKKEFAVFDKKYMQDARNARRSYGSGRIALGLLTMLHAEVPADDPVIVGGFEELAGRELIDTYTLGVALMAMSARYAPPGEAQLVRSGVLAAPRPRQLSAADRVIAEDWLASLLRNVDTRVDEAYRLRFNYTRGRRWDNSVNQYGLLGMHAASLCQLEVSSTAWRAAAAHLIEVACRDEGLRRLDVTTYLERKQAAQSGEKTRAAGARVPVRGHAYLGPGSSPAYGSMTTAGLTGLALARAGMMRAGLARADIMPDVRLALDSGFAWLDAHFDVRCNPGHVARAYRHWYYYLYGLERACELSGIALVGDRDWFYEGALQMLPHQRDDGAFRPGHSGGQAIESTCFAILFLKKATLPAATGR